MEPTSSVTSDGVQLQKLGKADGSDYSQGHYRMYFGVGDNEKIQLLRVFWPDGCVEEVENPAVDQLLVIRRQPSQKP